MNETQLKENYLSWLESITIRTIARNQAKQYLKEAESNLKKAKKVFNLTTRDWVQARKEAEKTKRRWKTYPYRMRKWAKENMDKVLSLIENNNLMEKNNE
jgi:hypothetical protein